MCFEEIMVDLNQYGINLGGLGHKISSEIQMRLVGDTPVQLHMELEEIDEPLH